MSGETVRRFTGADIKDLGGALVRVVIEARGCPPTCTLEFHQWALSSVIKIATGALARIDPNALASDYDRQVKWLTEENARLAHDLDAASIDQKNALARVKELEGALRSIAENKLTGPSPIGPAHGAGISMGIEIQASIARAALSGARSGEEP